LPPKPGTQQSTIDRGTPGAVTPPGSAAKVSATLATLNPQTMPCGGSCEISGYRLLRGPTAPIAFPLPDATGALPSGEMALLVTFLVDWRIDGPATLAKNGIQNVDGELKLTPEQDKTLNLILPSLLEQCQFEVNLIDPLNRKDRPPQHLLKAQIRLNIS
jgi:hypothetical protein